MTSLRERVARAIAPAYDSELSDLRSRVRELGNKAMAFDAAWERFPYYFARPDYTEGLRELSTDAQQWLTQLSGWEAIGSFGSATAIGEAERRQAVELSRMGYNYLTLVEREVSMWGDFAFSAKPTVMIDDEKAQDDFNNFWQSDANTCILSASRLPLLSATLLVDGEIFPTFFISKVDGKVTIRTVSTDQIGTIIRPSGDDAGVLGYIRQSVNGNGTLVTRTYRDWATTQRALEKAVSDAQLAPGTWATKETPGTDVVMQHVWYTGLNRRGWPAFHKGVWWARRYQDFLSWRLTLARSVATFWEDLETTGGSRDVKNIQSVLQSAYALGGESETNPAAPVGSIFAHNAAVKRQRMPLGTGAGDAEIDGMTVLSYAGLAAGIPPHWLGRPDMMQNRATARELLLPVMRQWERYQSMWEDTIREWARIVLRAAQTYPTKQRARYGKPIEELTIEVNMPTALSSAEFPELIAALTGLAQAGILRQQEVAKIALGLPELGIQDPDEIYGVMFPETSAGGAGEEGTAPESAPAAGGPVDADQTLNPDEEPEQTAEMSEAQRLAIIEAAQRAMVDEAVRRVLSDPFELGEYGTAASGNRGHAGVKGQLGGSAPGGGSGTKGAASHINPKTGKPDVAEIGRLVSDAINEDPGRGTHGNTATNAFWIVGDKIVPNNEWSSIAPAMRGKAISVHSHGSENAPSGEPFEPFSSPDIKMLLDTYRKGQGGSIMATIMSDGRMEMLQITAKTNVAVFRKSARTIQDECFGGRGGGESADEARQQIAGFAQKYGLAYHTGLRWKK